MARWRLTAAHYLKVPGTEWEQKETDQQTGKQGRKVYPVPLYLDPNNAADCNYPGEIIVSNKHSAAHPKDIVFSGPPTPDMEPIDDEAIKITEPLKRKWETTHPIEALPTTVG